MYKGPFDSLNIYLYGIRKSGLKNTIGNQPLLRCENFYLCHNIWCHNFCVTIFGVRIFEITNENFFGRIEFYCEVK